MRYLLIAALKAHIHFLCRRFRQASCRLENQLRRLRPAARAWFDTLPPMITVYRGSQRGRERGLSWTTDCTVAEGFAQVKRCINSEPTLCTAQIPKRHVFAVFLDRNEREIVLDPRRLRRLQVEPWKGGAR
jgi:hypothetical protein